MPLNQEEVIKMKKALIGKFYKTRELAKKEKRRNEVILEYNNGCLVISNSQFQSLIYGRKKIHDAQKDYRLL